MSKDTYPPVERYGLVLGDLGPKYRPMVRKARALRRWLEARVFELRGKVDLEDAAEINAACRCEITAQLTGRRLAEDGEPLSARDLTGLLKLNLEAVTRRNRHLARLGIQAGLGQVDPTAKDPWLEGN